jgi:ribonuclease HI
MTISAPHFLLFSESQAPRAAEDGQLARPHSRGQWRFVLETVDGQIRFEAADEEVESEDGRLALLAVVRGLEALEQPSRVTVVTTSRYVSRGFLFGLEEWRENGWRWERFGEMTPIKNRDLWQRIDRAMQYHQVE